MFGRVSDSVKSIGKSSKGRGEKASQRKRKRAQSSPGYSGLGMETSVTSALTEPSIIHQLQSTVAATPVRPISEGKDVEEAGRKRIVYEHYVFDKACCHSSALIFRGMITCETYKKYNCRVRVPSALLVFFSRKYPIHPTHPTHSG